MFLSHLRICIISTYSNTLFWVHGVRSIGHNFLTPFLEFVRVFSCCFFSFANLVCVAFFSVLRSCRSSFVACFRALFSSFVSPFFRAYVEWGKEMGDRADPGASAPEQAADHDEELSNFFKALDELCPDSCENEEEHILLTGATQKHTPLTGAVSSVATCSRIVTRVQQHSEASCSPDRQESPLSDVFRPSLCRFLRLGWFLSPRMDSVAPPHKGSFRHR